MRLNSQVLDGNLRLMFNPATGFPGGLKERSAIDQWDRDPTKILKDAVKGMLPKNKMQIYRMEKLKIFPEAEHPFTDFDLVSESCTLRASSSSVALIDL